MSIRRIFILPLVCLILASCGVASIHGNTTVIGEATFDDYAQKKHQYGVVLLDARWSRQWSCGKFENAELRGFAFDRLEPVDLRGGAFIPLPARAADAPADLMIYTSRSLAPSPFFQSYALLTPPGKYALSGISIKVAQSVSEVGYLNYGRADLIPEGKPLGGIFHVAAGEVVYIGNFALDCQLALPTLWRYYSQGKASFQLQLNDYHTKYPFIDLSNVQYRLFDTEVFGLPYTLE